MKNLAAYIGREFSIGTFHIRRGRCTGWWERANRQALEPHHVIVFIKRERLLDRQRLHHGEADAIGEAEPCSVVLLEDLPGSALKVGVE